MSIIYRCDICGLESHNWNDLQTIKVSYHDGECPTMRFEACEKCKTKLLKPVKEFRAYAKVNLVK